MTREEAVNRLTELEIARRDFIDKLNALGINNYRVEVDCRVLWPFTDEDPPAISV